MALTAGQFRSPKGEYLMRFASDGNGNAEGTGNYLHTGESYRFYSIWEGIKWMEKVMDKEKFPEKAREFISWAKTESAGYEKAAPIRFREEEDIRTPYAASFIIRVQYRYNASWQGTVQWMEGMQVLHFKSVFELMKLIDNALEQESNQYGSNRISIPRRA